MAKQTGATLLVAKLDRLSSSVAEIAKLFEDKSLDFRVATMPHADKFQLHVYAALAEQERDFNSLWMGILPEWYDSDAWDSKAPACGTSMRDWR